MTEQQRNVKVDAKTIGLMMVIRVVAVVGIALLLMTLLVSNEARVPETEAAPQVAPPATAPAAQTAPEPAPAEQPLRAHSRVDFYTLVGPEDGRVALGNVSTDVRAKEGLDESCATIPGRWVEVLGERDKYVLLRYHALEPRQLVECPTGTTYLMETDYYREMDYRYVAREEIQGP